MTRRVFLAAAGAALAQSAPLSKMGIATTSFSTGGRRDTFAFLDYCHGLGAGGIQAGLTSLEPDFIRGLRKRADQLGMYIEVITGLPRDNGEAFEKVIRAAKEAGALAVRVACLSGRRYETFSTHVEWKDFAEKSRDGVIRAASIAEKHRVPVAIENHKDWTSDELVKLLKQIGSEYLGVCLDTGNNVALLEEPMAVVEALAPYALSTHMKDMALAEMPQGFELSEVPFGEGTLDLKRVSRTISAARPKTRFTLEMITRNPLQVPCLTTKYWATFPDRSGYLLVMTLQTARSNPRPLPRIDGLDAAAKQKLEEDNVRRCLDYARRELAL